MLLTTMAYSIVLRRRVVGFIVDRSSKGKAVRRFSISIWCVHNWYRRADLALIFLEPGAGS